jgi:predicted nuclease of restriction endonuclease-like RecB superfamily
VDNAFWFFILGGILFVFCFSIIYWLILKILKYWKKKYQPLRANYYTCLDGHIVKSRGELIIDNHLYRLGINHDYENTIKVRGKELKYDWYLPDFDVYIEYWGYFGKDYIKRKKEKLELYQKGKLNLISIEDIMLQNAYLNLENQLEKYFKFKQASLIKKFCPECGVTLDNRF